MNFWAFYDRLSDKQKGITIGLGLGVGLALIFSVLTFHFTASYYGDKLDKVDKEFTTYRYTHPDTGQVKAEEDLIDKAIKDKLNKVPLKENVGEETQTEISYVPKTSKDDSDVEVTNTIKPVVVSYNGKREELKTTTTENQTTGADGKVVITQQTASTIDIDSIVNREIANRILEDEHKEAVLKRQKKQNLFWGVVGGYAVGKLINK